MADTAVIERVRQESHRWTRPSAPVNVGKMERWGSAIAGATLVAAGLTTRRGRWLLALLGGSLMYRGVTGHCHLYGALGLNTAEHNPATAVPAQQGAAVERAVTVQRSPEELYGLWRQLEKLPQIMSHLVAVKELDQQRSHWVAKGPLNSTLEWDAEIIEDRPHEVVSWRSVQGSQVSTAGSVRFEPASHGRGTVVRVTMKYDPPAGKTGDLLAHLTGDSLEQQLDDDLRRFKQLVEAGEVTTNQMQPIRSPGV